MENLARGCGCGTDAICDVGNRATTKEAQDFMVCAFCGKTREHIVFVIGAGKEPDWMLVEGTGKMTCPDCWEFAREEGKAACDKYVRDYNARY